MCLHLLHCLPLGVTCWILLATFPGSQQVQGVNPAIVPRVCASAWTLFACHRFLSFILWTKPMQNFRPRSVATARGPPTFRLQWEQLHINLKQGNYIIQTSNILKNKKNIKNRLKKQHQVWQSRLTQLEPSSNFHGLSPSRSDKISDTFCFAILRWVLAAPPARVMACMHTLMALTSGKDDFASFPPSDPSLCPRLYHWRVS